MIYDIALVAVVVAVACALPGVFLVLRQQSLQSDAISHSVLFGIVICFFLVRSLDSPLLLVGAVATGILTVLLSEVLLRTGLLKEDASIGLVFPLLFSVAVILISLYAGDIHLDTDAVLTGEIGLAPFHRWVVFGVDLGPQAVWSMGAIGAANLALLVLFFKELKISTFDPGLAASLGFRPGWIHYGLMVMVSLTAVGAFDSVGSILVVALMIAPAATATLLSERLAPRIVLTVMIAAVAALVGVLAAFALDTSIAGTMAVAAGLLFAAAFLGAPGKGVISQAWAHRERRWVFAGYALGVHLLAHEGTPDQDRECRVDHLEEHLHWSGAYARRVVETAVRGGLVTREGPRLNLTPLGRETVRSLMDRG